MDRSIGYFALTLTLGLAAIGLAGCGGGGGGGGVAAMSLHAPTGVKATAGDGSATVSWSPVTDATSYTVYWSQTAGAVDIKTANAVAMGAPPFVHSGIVNGQIYGYVVTSTGPWGESSKSASVAAVPSASSTIYDPPWAGASPSQVLFFNYDALKTTEQNGTDLAIAIFNLQPGQMLRISTGTYTMSFGFSVSLQGTAAQPIWIVNAPGATPVIRAATKSINVMNVGIPADGGAEYVVFRGIEFVNGSAGVRLVSCNNIWFDQNIVHDLDEAGLTANSYDASYLYITRNEIHHTGGTGEGMYLGGNFGSVILSNSIVALNHVHDTFGTDQGDGIELKQGSWGNWIVGNYVHDTNYPCILVGGTAGQPINVIERNICHTSNNEVMQVQGEALVVNNLLVDGLAAFYSSNHQGSVTNLKVVHNTIVNTGNAAVLNNWAGKPGMVFANNVCYSKTSMGLGFGSGTAGVTVVGNVAFGTIYNTPGGYVMGSGLLDFVGLAWDASALNAMPALGGALIGAGDPVWVVLDDITGALRSGSVEAGCYDAP